MTAHHPQLILKNSFAKGLATFAMLNSVSLLQGRKMRSAAMWKIANAHARLTKREASAKVAKVRQPKTGPSLTGRG